MGRTASTEPQCLYSTAIPLLPLWTVRPLQNLSACRVQLYLYSPYGPYGPYRTSVPVQYSYTSTPPMDRTACTEPQCLYSTAIPLLPLWAVRPVQNLRACTVQLYLYSPYRPYSLHRASVPLQGALYIPLQILSSNYGIPFSLLLPSPVYDNTLFPNALSIFLPIKLYVKFRTRTKGKTKFYYFI